MGLSCCKFGGPRQRVREYSESAHEKPHQNAEPNTHHELGNDVDTDANSQGSTLTLYTPTNSVFNSLLYAEGTPDSASIAEVDQILAGLAAFQSENNSHVIANKDHDDDKPSTTESVASTSVNANNTTSISDCFPRREPIPSTSANSWNSTLPLEFASAPKLEEASLPEVLFQDNLSDDALTMTKVDEILATIMASGSTPLHELTAADVEEVLASMFVDEDKYSGVSYTDNVLDSLVSYLQAAASEFENQANVLPLVSSRDDKHASTSLIDYDSTAGLSNSGPLNAGNCPVLDRVDTQTMHGNELPMNRPKLERAKSMELIVTPPRSFNTLGCDETLIGYVWSRRYQPSKVNAGSYPFLDNRDMQQRYSYRLRRVATEGWTNALRFSIKPYVGKKAI